MQKDDKDLDSKSRACRDLRLCAGYTLLADGLRRVGKQSGEYLSALGANPGPTRADARTGTSGGLRE